MIKASFEILQPASSQSFLVRKFDKLAFDAPYHFHEEYELTCIINGSGKRYVGSHMEDFISGDLVLLGPELPHCWKLDLSETLPHEASAIVIQFNDAFLGDEFFNKFELQLIKRLFQKSSCGISFHSETQEEVKRLLIALVEEKSNFKVLIGLLEILHYMASSAQYALLDEYRIVAGRSIAGRERITPVFAYLAENFRKQVSLDKAAGIANMTTNAFCKYFKKITHKTFVETIIEYRLNYAIQQLVQTDKPVSEISYESGFNDVSHFYRMFKAKMHLSPLNYRKRFMHNLIDDKKLSA